MPRWLQILVALAGLANFAIAGWYFFDKVFRTRKASERDKSVEDLTKRMASLEGKQATSQQLIDAEHRLSRIEGDVLVLKETAALREKIMANILHSPHRPELDRLLEKIDRGEWLTDDEVGFARKWLWEIIMAPESEGISQGDKVSAGDIYASLTVKQAQRVHA